MPIYITYLHKHRLQKAENRLHIVEGLLLALKKIDQIIKVIKASKDVDTARKSLMTKFKLSEIQASHILDMPLRRLTALEMEKLEEEKKDLKETIKELNYCINHRLYAVSQIQIIRSFMFGSCRPGRVWGARVANR